MDTSTNSCLAIVPKGADGKIYLNEKHASNSSVLTSK